MGARHRARPASIQIMKVQVIPASKLRSKNLRQFVVSTEYSFFSSSLH